MAFAVVEFKEGVVSEAPSNWLEKDGEDYACWWPPKSIKNKRKLMEKRVSPEKLKWELLPVSIRQFCTTLDRARKTAENSDYTTTDEQAMGKGYRKKITNKVYSDTSDESDENNNPNSQPRNKIFKIVEASELPTFFDESNSIINLQNKTISDSNSNALGTKCSVTKPSFNTPSSRSMPRIVTDELLEGGARIPELLSTFNSTPSSRSAPIVADELQRTNIPEILSELNGKFSVIVRMLGTLELQIRDITQRLDRIIPDIHVHGVSDRIDMLLPLNSIQDIESLEIKLTEEAMANELKSFITKQGGNGTKDALHRIFAAMFSNQCAQACSWIGRSRKDAVVKNFAVNDLNIMKILKHTLLDRHERLTTSDFEDIAKEWFRLGKQRFMRERAQRK